MKKLLKILIIILILFGGIIISSPIWIKSLLIYVLEKNFGGEIKIEELSLTFPNKLFAGNIYIGNKIALANVSLSVGNIFRLSPVYLDLTKPKILVIHNEKGEWIFPSIPGLEGAKNGASNILNIEIRAKINEGIVIVRDIKTKKDINISNVNANLVYKDQKITYTATAVLPEERYKSVGVYKFSDNSGNLSFEFKHANAKDWAPFFLPDLFLVNFGKFNGNISVFSENNMWYVKGNIDANKVKIGLKDFNLNIDNFNTVISIDKEVIKISKGQGELNGAILSVSGKVLPDLSLEIGIKDLDLSNIDSLYLSNNLSLKGKGDGNFKILGKLENPDILGRFSIKEGSIYNLSFSNLELISNSKFPKININISASLKSGKIEGFAEYDINKTQGKLTINGENIDIRGLIEPFNLPPVEGTASLKIEGKGEKVWKFNIEGEVLEGKLGEYSAEKLKFFVEGEWEFFNFFSPRK